MEEAVSFCGRVLTASEMHLVRQIIEDFPRLSQAELAYTICELLEWRRPNGKLKSPECMGVWSPCWTNLYQFDKTSCGGMSDARRCHAEDGD